MNLQKKRLRIGLFFLIFPIVFLTFNLHTTQAFWGEGLVKGALYMLFVFVGWFTSVAVTLFAYVIDPQYISGDSGLLNLQAVYDMWKFVRDFINIFFILGLLFIAFAFVFQIDSYSNSKSIIKLVIAALLVNFSFPIARLIIDLANVPMYFFLQMIAGNNSNAVALESSLSASRLSTILLPAAERSDITALLAAIIFLFIFNVTIFVFAFQFLIRLIALIILVILSPIGFVANSVPGLKERGFGKDWWDAFLKYCFFGPAAIFMLLLATNFFAAISNSGAGDPYANVTSLASVSSDKPDTVASMVLFFIPITMLWFAIGVSSKFSIAGASVATSYGKKFAKWAGKKATYNNSVAKGLGRGIKKRAEKTTGLKLLTPKYWNEGGARTEALVSGYVSGGSKGITSEREKLHAKKVAEEEKKLEEERTNESTLRATMNNSNADKAKREAAIRILSKKDALRTNADMEEARKAIQETNINPETIKEKQAELVKKAGGEIYQTGTELAAAIETLGDDVKGVSALIDKASPRALETLNPNQYQSIANKHPNIKGKLDNKLKKEGKRRVIIQAKIAETIVAEQDATNGPMSQERINQIQQEVYNSSLKGIKAKDIGNIEDIHGDKELVNFVRNEIDSGNWSDKDIQDAYAGLENADKERWRANKLYPASSKKVSVPNNATDLVNTQRMNNQEKGASAEGNQKPSSAADIVNAQRRGR